MSQPKRIQRKRTKGFRLPEGCVYVGRPTQWGNPFVVGPGVTRGDAVELFVALCVRDYARLARMPWTAGAHLLHGPFRDMAELLEPLRGHDLACWCPLDQPCHGDVLLALANKAAPEGPAQP